MRINFDLAWLFQLGDYPNAYEIGFDDAHWRKLNVPHDWSIEGEYSRNNSTGRRCGFLPAGIGWYRKYFDVSKEWIGQQIYIEFDGVYMNSEVWVNGHYIGKRPYGYISFQYDISKYVHAGSNVIAVKVDNDKNPSGRWYTGSGIYRHTWLSVKNKIHLIEDEIFAYTPKVNEEEAYLNVEFEIENKTNEDSSGELEICLLDKEGNLIAQKSKKVDINRKGANGVIELTVAHPKLWSPDTPELYTIRLKLKKENEILDNVQITTGFRYFSFDANTGFKLNGKSLKFKGVCNHHDAGPLGAAVPDKVLETRLMQLKEMGCNAIRTSHNPFTPEFYDMCDKIGIMVMNEIFDGWHKKADYDYGALYFDEWWERDVTDFVCRDRNHPCIILWSIGNETGKEDIHKISELFHKLDPTRPTTGGQILYGVDIAGFNGPSETPGELEKVKLEHPDWKIILTEVPHTYQTRGFYRTKTWWRDYKRGRYDIPDLTVEEIFDDYAARYSHTVTYNSSYDNATARINNRDCWRRTRDTQYICGQFQWTGYDYLGESFGWPHKSGNNGIIDLCGFPKDIYYFYKSQWTDTPVLHILPHWTHPGKEGVIIPVLNYTNCEAVEMFLNGRSLGRQKTSGRMNIEWNIPYKPGTLKAIGEKNGEQIICEIKTATEPAQIVLTADTENLRADSLDIAQVTISITDKNGVFVPYADNRVYFHVSGSANFRAVGNGDPADLECHIKRVRKAFNGLCKAFIQSTSENSGAVLTAAGVMGDTFFKNQTDVSICYSQIVLQPGSKLQEPVIYYTVDGTIPTTASNKYEGPFTIDSNTTVKVLFMLGDQAIHMGQEFTKGKKKDEDNLALIPRSKNITGTWLSNKGDTYIFHENGEVEINVRGETIATYNWWYEDPIDQFENDQGDIDNGGINFLFYEAPLRLIDKHTLRVKDRSKVEMLKRK